MTTPRTPLGVQASHVIPPVTVARTLRAQRPPQTAVTDPRALGDGLPPGAVRPPRLCPVALTTISEEQPR